MGNIPEEYWNAIVGCDSSYDDSFIYAVKTTGICCKPSCKSRVPKRENVAIFKNAYMAIEQGFRPCKRCKPDGSVLPAVEWIGQITDWINQNYQEHITLEELSQHFHGSPFHLQRLFKRVQGVSPAEYIQRLRLKKAIEMLETDEKRIAEVASAVGFYNTPYFITLFKKQFGCTPAAFRKRAGKYHES